MTDEARSLSGLGALWQYMHDLVEAKRKEPGPDVLSDLVAAEGEEANPGGDAVAMLGAGLLFAGHETTVAAIDKGVVLFVMNPALRQALLREPAVVAGAVEEILRLPLPVPAPEGAGGLPRWAKVDMDVEGMVVRAGELVLLDLQDANLDDQVFPGPERLDPSRAQNAHLTFGHGAHYCIGAPLARMELQLLFGALVRRFPTLQLAVDVEDLCPRSHLLTGGLQSLPVTW